jgi:hypothetical protein
VATGTQSRLQISLRKNFQAKIVPVRRWIRRQTPIIRRSLKMQAKLNSLRRKTRKQSNKM